MSNQVPRRPLGPPLRLACRILSSWAVEERTDTPHKVLGLNTLAGSHPLRLCLRKATTAFLPPCVHSVSALTGSSWNLLHVLNEYCSLNPTTVLRLDRRLTIAIIIIVNTKTPIILPLHSAVSQLDPEINWNVPKKSSEPAAISLIFVLTRNLLP